jgi:hypothetical protein
MMEQHRIARAAEIYAEGMISPDELWIQVLDVIGEGDVSATLDRCPERVRAVLRGAYAERPIDIHANQKILAELKAWCAQRSEAAIARIPPPGRGLWLRTAIVLIAVLAIGVGWLMSQIKWKNDRGAAIDRLQSLRPQVGLAFDLERKLVPWRIRLVGGPGYERIYWMRFDESDSIMAQELTRLFPEAKVLPLSEDEFLKYRDAVFFAPDSLNAPAN